MSEDNTSSAPAVCTLDGVCLEPAVLEETTEDEPGTTEKQAAPQPKAPRRNKKKSNTSSTIIKNVHSQPELNTLINSNEAVVVEFMTSWCGACKGIAPLYEELAETNDVACAQVLCDKNKETKKLATAHGVSSYPVFVLYQDGASVGRWNGADRGKLEKAFERLSGGGGKKKGDGRRRGR